MSVIPCLTWVRRGKAKSVPTKVQIDKEDLKRIIDDTEERLAEQDGASDDEDRVDNIENEEVEANSVDAEIQAARDFANQIKGKAEKDDKNDEENEDDMDIDRKYNLEDYDKEENDYTNPLKGIGKLTLYASNEDDPYMTTKNDDDSDTEDFEIKPSDNLLLVARASDEYCSLEVHVYNEENNDFYVHHDMLLPSFPLAVEWLDYDMTDESNGNFVAIASMEPTIDIWDLDIVDNLEPLAVLGERKKKNKETHKDSVLDLSWNKLARGVKDYYKWEWVKISDLSRFQKDGTYVPLVQEMVEQFLFIASRRHVLASASADKTVGLWDLSEGKMAMSVAQHKDKVQCVKWHPAEEHMLLSGSFDKTVKLYDCRAPDTNCKTWTMNGEVEKLLWNPFNPWFYFASTDVGHIYYMDSRQDQPVYTLAACTEAVTGMSLSSENQNLLVTSSTDGAVKVWDIADNKPSMVHTRNLKMGQIYCSEGCPDSPYMFAFGSQKNIKVLNLQDSAAGYLEDMVQNYVSKHFCGGASGSSKGGKKFKLEGTLDPADMAGFMETDTTDTHPKKNKKKKMKKKKGKKGSS